MLKVAVRMIICNTVTRPEPGDPALIEIALALPNWLHGHRTYLEKEFNKVVYMLTFSVSHRNFTK